MIELYGAKLIIFDADGTLRRSTVDGQVCPNKPGEWELLPNVKDVCRLIQRERPEIALAIASNQGGVALGYLDHVTALRMLYDTAREAFGPSWPVFMCPHAPDAGCACRKPRPGLLLDAMALWDIPEDRVLYVGDMPSDHDAAISAGVRFVWAKDFFGWE